MSYVCVPWNRQKSERVKRVSLPSGVLEPSIRDRVESLEKEIEVLKDKLKEK